MLFGTSAFSETPFSSQTAVIRIVSVTGVQVDTALGSSTITGDAIVTVSGNQVAVALGTPTVRMGKTVEVTGVEATVQLGTDIVITWWRNSFRNREPVNCIIRYSNRSRRSRRSS